MATPLYVILDITLSHMSIRTSLLPQKHALHRSEGVEAMPAGFLKSHLCSNYLLQTFDPNQYGEASRREVGEGAATMARSGTSPGRTPAMGQGCRPSPQTVIRGSP